MIRSRKGGRRHIETAELNITAFMNLMVILVPFLLITAVFSRLAILELNLPASSTEPANPQELTFQLEVIVRADKIEVGDRNVGALGVYPNTDDGYDYESLSTKLSEIKDRYPEKTDASILLESEIAYDTLVQVMDRVRIAEEIEEESIVSKELFPGMSGSKVSGVYLFYELTEKGREELGDAVMLLNNTIQLKHTGAAEVNLTVSDQGTTWTLKPADPDEDELGKFNPDNITNMALVCIYESKVTF